MRSQEAREFNRFRAAFTLVAATLAILTGSIVAASADPDPVDQLVSRFSESAITLLADNGTEIATRRRASTPSLRMGEAELVRTLADIQLSPRQAASLWSFFADVDNVSFLTLPIVKALITASATPSGHDAMWSELGGLVERDKRDRGTAPTLLSFFTKHRQTLLPLLRGIQETEGAGNAMVDVMSKSRLFHDEIDGSVQWMGINNPAALARRIERERERGRPVAWEAEAVEQMKKWKERHYGPKASEAARTAATEAADAEAFVVIFNCLHGQDDWYRRQMLSGISPFDAFSIVVGGEAQLYALGTSGYRNHLHALIMRGIADSGSFEAFLEKASRTSYGELPRDEVGRRRMVFLRIVSAFGLLDSVLAAVKDRQRFIADAIDSLADAQTLESNASVILDIVGGRSNDAASVKFRAELLDRLYTLRSIEPDAKRRSTFGSVLSVYQNLSGVIRDPEIDRLYKLDRSLTQPSFEALFSPVPDGGYVHRMFMRLDEDVDASSNHAGFRALMIARGASLHIAETFEAYRIRKNNRLIEIYLNRPSAAGLKTGVEELARILDGVMIHTVIGRGHTGIITPLRNDVNRLLGDRRRRVATVILGACGGSASTRELIDTFGYRTIISTRATGRQLINNAIIDQYLTTLLALAPGETLAVDDVLSKAVGPFLKAGDEELREDARFYHVNAANVYAAMLFDRHVHERRSTAHPAAAMARADAQPMPLTWREAASRDQLYAPRQERSRVANARSDSEGQAQKSTTFAIEFER